MISFVLLKTINMSTAFLAPESTGTKIIHRTAITERKKTTGNTKTKPGVGYWRQFINFAAAQERNRFGWLAAAITLQGCVLAPLTLLAIISNGNPFILWIPCIIAFAITEVVFLAAMPTRITIPVLFAGIITDIMVVLACFTLF
jgi:hypothetical protein